MDDDAAMPLFFMTLPIFLVVAYYTGSWVWYIGVPWFSYLLIAPDLHKFIQNKPHTRLKKFLKDL